MVVWLREFHLDSGDHGSHFKPGLNRDRLCGQGPRRGCTVGVKSHTVVSMVAWLLGCWNSIYTLEIVVHILNPV